MSYQRQETSGFTIALRWMLIVGGAAMLTLTFFMVLPLIQAINALPDRETLLAEFDVTQLPPPDETPDEPPPPEDEPPPEPEPPQLQPETPRMELSEIELALNPGFGSFSGDFGMQINAVTAGANAVDELFTSAELDQKPVVIHDPAPDITRQMRQRGETAITVIFIVGRDGRVETARIMGPSDPIFERAALRAVRQWRFEPGKRDGEPVRFRMRQIFRFNRGK